MDLLSLHVANVIIAHTLHNHQRYCSGISGQSDKVKPWLLLESEVKLLTQELKTGLLISHPTPFSPTVRSGHSWEMTLSGGTVVLMCYSVAGEREADRERGTGLLTSSALSDSVGNICQFGDVTFTGLNFRNYFKYISLTYSLSVHFAVATILKWHTEF